MSKFNKFLFMNHNLNDFIENLKKGKIQPLDAAEYLERLLKRDSKDAFIDHDREERCGLPEVIYGENKSAKQILNISQEILSVSKKLLVTRISKEKYSQISKKLPACEYDESARCLYKKPIEKPLKKKTVLVICAGTSDLPVAREAEITASMFGCTTDLMSDVGVAGIHRILSQTETLNKATVIIVVAGMEGALPSVIGGLVSVPVIALPTSIGYGTSFSGVTALLGMLNSCASGLTVVNIDNGFGAGYAAGRIINSV